MRARILALAAAAALTLSVAVPAAALSPEPPSEPCVPSEGSPEVPPTFEEVVVSEAWTETIEHPAVVAVERKWVRVSPFVEYRWAVDDPGKAWAPYPSSRHQWTREVVVSEAWTETIEHPAVTELVMTDPGSPAVPPVVCPDPEPTDPPVDPPADPEDDGEDDDVVIPVPPAPPAPAAPAAAVRAAPAFTG